MTATVIPITHAKAPKRAALRASGWNRALIRAETSAARIAAEPNRNSRRLTAQKIPPAPSCRLKDDAVALMFQEVDGSPRNALSVPAVIVVAPELTVDRAVS